MEGGDLSWVITQEAPAKSPEVSHNSSNDIQDNGMQVKGSHANGIQTNGSQTTGS
jgi:hypothetical protein